MDTAARIQPGPGTNVKLPSVARTVVASACLVWVSAAILVSLLLIHARNETLEREKESTARLVLALEEHTTHMFQAVDMTLASVADTLRLSPDLRRNPRAFHDKLRERLEELQPSVRAIVVIGADGRVLHDTNAIEAPDISLADRPYFSAHRDDPTLKRFVSAPLDSRAGAGWILAVTRRLGDDSEFSGIALAAVQPDYFESLYRRMGLAGNDIISLFHANGTLIARHPDSEGDIGKSYAGRPLFAQRLTSRSADTFMVDGGQYDFQRIVSYRAMVREPVVISVMRGTDSVLAIWRRTAISASAGLLALMVLLAALALLVVQQHRDAERSRERLAQAEKLEALGHLTGGIAHDFGNLLYAVSSNLSVIMAELPEGRAREAATGVKRAVLRATELIQRMMTIAKRQPLNLQPASLNECLREAAPLLRQAAGSRVVMVMELDESLGPCMIDRTELEVALINVIANARDAMGGVGRVILRTRMEQAPGGRSFASLSVQDNGPGMAEAVRRRALDPYFTTKGDGGTGLGLARVYGFLRQVGGDVRLESEPGAGAVVTMLFPLEVRPSGQGATLRAA